MTMDEFLESGGGGGEDVTMTNEMETSHKAGLEGLKEKDPSFYEFLKQNDKDLLEFDPDELVEEEEDEEMEDGPVEGGLTVEILSKWEKLLIKEKSLGTLKKVLIAVRNAAANVTGEEAQNGNVKYVLTDPQGILSPNSTNLSFRSIVDDCIPTHSRSFTAPCSCCGKGRENPTPLTKHKALANCSSSKIALSLDIGSPPQSIVSTHKSPRPLTDGEVNSLYNWIPEINQAIDFFDSRYLESYGKKCRR